MKFAATTVWAAILWMAIWLVKFYQRFLSTSRTPCCRFYPTCSEYAVLAIEKHGICKGFLKAAWRVVRCNPLGKSGVDFP